MAQIRNTIELLSRILRENGTSRIKAETFRQAKFNQSDGVEPLWRLLFELLYFNEYRRIDTVCIKACTELSPEEMVVYVKRELQKRGFYSWDFAALPVDMSMGSRDLLLALGWLLCKENLIPKFMLSCTSPIDDDTASLYKMSGTEVGGEGDAGVRSTFSQDTPSHQDCQSRVRQLLWLNNKLRLNLRSLHAMQREKNLLKHKIHKATMSAGRQGDSKHLSMLEVYMLKHPEILKKNLELLEADNERLQNLLRWRDHEDVYWKWMESVLDAKLTDQAKAAVAAAGGDSTRTKSSPRLLDDKQVVNEGIAGMADSRLNLQEAIVKYESIVEHLERLWDEKSAEVSEDELDTVLSSLDLELSMLKTSISHGNTDSSASPQSSSQQQHQDLHRWMQKTKQQQEPVLYYDKPAMRGPRNTIHTPSSLLSSPTSSTAPSQVDIEDIQSEIAQLNNVVDRLQGEVDIKQNSFKEELQILSSRLQDAICIPPLGLND